MCSPQVNPIDVKRPVGGGGGAADEFRAAARSARMSTIVTPERGADMSSWPAGISAITLFVEDLAAAKAFYTRAFGLPVHYEDPSSAVFNFGNALINLLVVGEANELIGPAKVGGPEAGARAQFTLTVDDVDATCADLAARGVDLLNGPIDRPWGIRTAAFQDPAGNVWEIAH
jgi:catechol 2,3-dioxygenase-like lactoylglutathione lyase family enzyme